VEVARITAGSVKTFRRYDQYQPLLLPPSLDDWPQSKHTAARLVSEILDHDVDRAADEARESTAAAAPRQLRLPVVNVARPL